MTLTIPTHRHFSLRSVISSHGWSALPPFLLNDTEDVISIALCLALGRALTLSIRQRGHRLIVDVSGQSLLREEKHEVIRTVKDMLRMNEDLSAFYRVARRHPSLRWIPRVGAGRLLRAPSVFEDTVKMICTTNCSWSLTTLMVTRLTESLGTKVDGRYTFPSAAAMADVDEKFYRTVIRAGYRSPYLVGFSRRVADGSLDLERLRAPGTPREEMLGTLLTVKGVGPYASDNLLRLLGVYDTFAHDSWIRAEYAERYHKGRRVSDRSIEKRYHEFDEWKGLVYWLDITRPWYGKRAGRS